MAVGAAVLLFFCSDGNFLTRGSNFLTRGGGLPCQTFFLSNTESVPNKEFVLIVRVKKMPKPLLPACIENYHDSSLALR